MVFNSETSARAIENHWIDDRKPLDWKSPAGARFWKRRQNCVNHL